MKRLLLTTIGCAALLSMTACSSPVVDVTPDMLQNQQWKLTQVDGNAVSTNATLEINDEARAAGSTGCNRFFGQSELQGNRIRVERMGMTRMACLDESKMKTEQIVAGVLTDWSDVSIQDGELILKGVSHTLTYVLANQPQ
ncbi:MULTISPECIES: META domain-containing protein [unclassified Vibrio]|uniref:META domain-containing protein n=1 Tax=unclassified Vibrio TaxID=2614977 RepID=UPI00136171BF|nr:MULTISPECIES: META domain-containing protein [unclassified Vibrio]NAW58557.1 META domain-containing protein [Vibrio sp. V36_P2S2PM302]NAX20152.1 META domain-containing protein [Vibrio sp. V39_P1S14PM300]NAX26658.1 META domain-containing protein [Vibrio sp. V38_P2S17PM301]NAX31815.1 META domain-containing protein [Vibrio sp. V37_P2S8PM304]